MSVTAIIQPERGCGRRKAFGLYLVGGTHGSPDGVLPRFVKVAPPIPYPVPVHRGPRVVNAQAVLGREPLAAWWLGSSLATEEKKRGDAWAIATFGMTADHRLRVGECAHSASVEDALSILVSRLSFGSKVIPLMRELSLEKIADLPKMAEHFYAFAQAVTAYANTPYVGELMEMQAAVWRMAHLVPPKKKAQYGPPLARLLVVLGLPKDAAALQRMFQKGV